MVQTQVQVPFPSFQTTTGPVADFHAGLSLVCSADRKLERLEWYTRREHTSMVFNLSGVNETFRVESERIRLSNS